GEDEDDGAADDEPELEVGAAPRTARGEAVAAVPGAAEAAAGLAGAGRVAITQVTLHRTLRRTADPPAVISAPSARGGTPAPPGGAPGCAVASISPSSRRARKRSLGYNMSQAGRQSATAAADGRARVPCS